ncbi:putative Isocitrate dehydrogenase (NAD(+)) [Desulfamplus magnetovallimortis]|uniref:isocitrate dehydrogenase (NADP(+)) n=1 Tax=Desulfamplus magnetovallimortis TaxID=1246637 RepID=A0A1W1HGN5_9BACT|nr:isocitrate/isopropylmalate family dehydrogenase [Desulfamplus magnetovallimortis]SLM31671.1 putative Isocitrate dehydrogenase (NAD(+)) [Desulfamplus magnetovallimortis]
MTDYANIFEGEYNPFNALATLLGQEKDRVEKAIKSRGSFNPVDLSQKRPLTIGFAPGDGIGPIIAKAARTILEKLLENEVKKGEISIIEIPDLTIEKRIELDVVAPQTSIDVIDKCDVILKMPLETPDSSRYPNVPSANVWMRQYMDLFACQRTIKNDEQDIDFTIFRCNMGTPYQDAMSAGVSYINGNEEYALCFWPQARIDIERITHLACLHAQKCGSPAVVLNFKDNVIKPDAASLNWAKAYIDKHFPDIDYLSVKPDDFSYTVTQPQKLKSMKGEKTGVEFRLTTMICNNIVGDMAGDEAGMYVGGIGGVGSANISFSQGMFEAGGGTGTRMMNENRGHFASPVAVVKATGELLEFIGYPQLKVTVFNAIDALETAGTVPNGGKNSITCDQATEFILKNI